MKTKLSTRFLSLLLCMLMCVSIIPAEAFAETDGTDEAEEIETEFATEEVTDFGDKETTADESATELTEEKEISAPADDPEQPAQEPTDEDGFSFDAFAETEEAAVTNDAVLADIVDSGTCGSKLTWTLDDEGTLTIDGTGSMTDYDGWDCNAPWFSNIQDIKTVTINSGVTSIGNSAFDNCFNMTEISIPTSIKSIGQEAFNYCSSLTSVSIPDSVTEIGDEAFYGCEALTSVTIGKSVKSIGSSAFDACPLQGSLTIPDSVTSIGDSAFRSCGSLTTVSIGQGLASIGEKAFSNCNQLKAINVDSNNQSYCSLDGVLFDKAKTTLIRCPGGKAGDYQIPAGVTDLDGEDGFLGCENLTSIKIPASMNSIGMSSFEGCSSLTAINVDAGNGRYSSVDGVLFNKTQTQLVKYPQGKSGNYEIPSGVTSIWIGSFSGCTDLTGVTIPDSVTSIEGWTFTECTSLKSIVIPDKVPSIGYDAFYCCTGLTSVTLGKGVTRISDFAFYGCSSLSTVTFRGNAPTFGDGDDDPSVFMDMTLKAYYPAGNSTWTSSVLQNYGGTVTWEAYELKPDVKDDDPGTLDLTVESINNGASFRIRWTYTNTGSMAKENVAIKIALDNKRLYFVDYDYTDYKARYGTVAPGETAEGTMSVMYDNSYRSEEPTFTVTVTSDQLTLAQQTGKIDRIPQYLYPEGKGYRALKAGKVNADIYAVSDEIADIAQNDYIEISAIYENSYGSIWARVSKINNKKLTTEGYVYLGNYEEHNHSCTYKTSSDTQHNVITTWCNVCGKGKKDKTTSEAHTFVNGVCAFCGKVQVASVKGNYLTVKYISLYEKDNIGSKILRALPEGTYVRVSKAAPNKSGNYWGLVTYVDDTKITGKAYVYMGDLTAHGNDYLYEYAPIDDINHSVTVTCSDCNYKETLTAAAHNPGDEGKCTLCGRLTAYDTKGNYTARVGLTLYKDAKATKSAGITVNPGIFIKVDSVSLVNNIYIGKVSQYGNNKKVTFYVKMIDLLPHTQHDYAPDYSLHCDLYHTERQICTAEGCGNILSSSNRDHNFENGVCTVCGHVAVTHDVGLYTVSRSGGEQVYAEALGSSKTLGTYPEGSLVAISKIEISKYNYYWGVTTVPVNGIVQTAYINMGSLTPHSHTCASTVSQYTDQYHMVTLSGSCACGAVSYPEAHTFDENGTCSVCGTKKIGTKGGVYIVTADASAYKIEKSIVTLYNKVSYKKGNVLTIAVDPVYIAVRDTWYGQVTVLNGVKQKTKLYIPMKYTETHLQHEDGAVTYTPKNNTSHIVNVACSICGETTSKIEGHDFTNGNGKCVYCGSPEVPTTAGWYIAVKDTDMVQSASSTAKKVSGNPTIVAGSLIKIEKTQKDSADNWWGRVCMIDGTKYSGNRWVYMGDLKAHEHTWGTPTLVDTTDKTHTLSSICKLCGEEKQEAIAHDYISDTTVSYGGERTCSVCGRLEPCQFAGDFLVCAESAKIVDSKYNEKKPVATVSRGTYICISDTTWDDKTETVYGKVTWVNDGKVKSSGKDYTSDAYIRMSDLEPHSLSLISSVEGTEKQHVYTYTCSDCGYKKTKTEAHSFASGSMTCSVCGEIFVNSEPGVYQVAGMLTIYTRKGNKLTTYKDISFANTPETDQGVSGHVYITAVDEVNGILIGKIARAGKTKFSGEKWVNMDVLGQDITGNVKASAAVYDKNKHTFSYTCDACGMTYSWSENHSLDSNGTCTVCDYAKAEKGTYYTDQVNCLIYSLTSKSLNKWSATVTTKYKATLSTAGSKVTLNGKQVYDADSRTLWVQLDSPFSGSWVRMSDLTDHIHCGEASCVEVNDEYHTVTEYPWATTCSVCGESLPANRLTVCQAEHHYELGVCKECGKDEVSTDKNLTYYAPYDGFTASTDRSVVEWKTGTVSRQLDSNGTKYHAGDEIYLTAIEFYNGYYWGTVKNSNPKEYVRMSALLTEKPADNHIELTDEELLAWCMGDYHGMNALYTYNYHTTELNKVGYADVLLMATTTRASGFTGVLFQLIREQSGETAEKNLIKAQILSMLKDMEAEESASYKSTIRKYTKDYVKAISKATKLVDIEVFDADFAKEHNIDRRTREWKELKSGLKNVEDSCSSFNDIMKLGEAGINLVVYWTSEFAIDQYMLDSLEELGNYYGDFKEDYYTALQEIKTDYSNKWLGTLKRYQDLWMDVKGEKVLKDLLNDYAGLAMKALGQKVSEQLAARVGEVGTLYSFVTYALDTGLKISGAEELSDSMQVFMAQINIVTAAESAYSAAVLQVRNGNHSTTALQKVRNQFSVAKAARKELYQDMLNMECSHVFGAKEDNALKNYLQQEISRIDDVYLTNDPAKLAEMGSVSYDRYKAA